MFFLICMTWGLGKIMVETSKWYLIMKYIFFQESLLLTTLLTDYGTSCTYLGIRLGISRLTSYTYPPSFFLSLSYGRFKKKQRAIVTLVGTDDLKFCILRKWPIKCKESGLWILRNWPIKCKESGLLSLVWIHKRLQKRKGQNTNEFPIPDFTSISMIRMEIKMLTATWKADQYVDIFVSWSGSSALCSQVTSRIGNSSICDFGFLIAHLYLCPSNQPYTAT